jgi:WD40 repeat protein
MSVCGRTADLTERGGLSDGHAVLFASAGLDGKIVFYDVAQSKVVKTMEVGSPLSALCFNDDGVTIAVGTSGGGIKIYDLRASKGNQPKLLLGDAHPAAGGGLGGISSLHFQRKRSKSHNSSSSVSSKSSSGTTFAASQPSRTSASAGREVDGAPSRRAGVAADPRTPGPAASSMESSVMSSAASAGKRLFGADGPNPTQVLR